jgi:hypothetical protein
MSSAPAAASAPPLLFRGLRGISSADVSREVLAGVTPAALAVLALIDVEGLRVADPVGQLLARYDLLEPIARATSSEPTATHSTPLNAAPSPGSLWGARGEGGVTP